MGGADPWVQGAVDFRCLDSSSWLIAKSSLRLGPSQASLPPVLGLSFTEIVVVLLVAVVVIGPRQLPVMLRTAGRWIAKLRRMAFDMRTQSGIDDILRKEGLDKDLRQLQALMRRGNVLDALAIDVDAEIAREKPSKTDSERLPLREPDDRTCGIGSIPWQGWTLMASEWMIWIRTECSTKNVVWMKRNPRGHRVWIARRIHRTIRFRMTTST